LNKSGSRIVASFDEHPVLALVTCGPQLEVALSGPSQRVVSAVRMGGVAPRSALVLAAADLLVEDAGITPDALAAIVISRGPGSFTGIRAGIATAAGLIAAAGTTCLAYDSLVMQAARCEGEGVVWCAQPGRRGEVYARSYRLTEGGAPQSLGEIEIVSIEAVHERGPWVAAEALDLGRADRSSTVRGAAEALLHLAKLGLPADAPEPLYVEGPPIHRSEPSGG
jgi:tRNA threonylcarbamoyl adenosine modification protein YeaZ